MNKEKKIPLSVAIITLNEEDRLPDCLESVRFADEIVVVDSGSTDNTVKIAEQFGARIFSQHWLGFGPQKQFAIDQCINDWVLILDADERLPEETTAEIYTLFAGSMNHAAYSFPRKNYFSGKWIRHGGWWPDRVVRLFRKNTCRMSSSMVHESIITKDTIGKIQNPISHYTNRNLHQTIDKINKYSSVGAKQLFNTKGNSSSLKALMKALWKFFHFYFIRLGFLDGYQGLVIAVSDAMNVFFKHAKFIEIKNASKTK